ncbi:MAG: penicillin-binding transpeptidase domain-containing protein, partial [bacterium]|nr:penicillin-binding transpeptidase domain-containing protein [bacterium]
ALDSHGWFAGWGAEKNSKDPEIVVAVFVKHGMGGSRAAAPIARKIMDTYFALKVERQKAK